MSEDTEVLDQNANDQVTEPVQETVQETESVETQPEVQKEDRPVWTMPVSKAQEEKKRAVEKALEQAKAEREAEIQRLKEEYESKLSQVAPKDDYETELRRVAEEGGLDPDKVVKLMEPLQKKLQSSLPDVSKFETLLKEKEIEEHKRQVSKEFDERVLPLIQKDYPQATPAHIQETRDRITELAFSKGYNTYALEDIYKVKRDDFEFKNQMSAEPSGGRSSELVDFSKMSDAEEHELAQSNPDKFREYLKWQSKNSSLYLDTD